MITAVDSSVLLDILIAHPTFGRASLRSIRRSRSEGRVVACDVVWAEVGGWFDTRNEATSVMSRFGVEFSPLSVEAALSAGTAWRAYRLQGGSRDRMVADFLIGGHASLQADRLLTRDPRFPRRYFPELPLVDPSEA